MNTNKIVCLYTPFYLQAMLNYMERHNLEMVTDLSNTIWHKDDVLKCLKKENQV